MPEGWQWDPTLFRGSAAYYDRGRLPYAPGFAEVLAASLGLDRQGRLLDVGCGPGTVTLPMARYFEEAVGVDPDQDMLAEAERRARHLAVDNVRWARARAEDLPAGLGTFRVVMFAQSFHWTDRDRVAATVFGMLAPGGAFVHMSDHKGPPAGPLPLPHPPPPLAQISELAGRPPRTCSAPGSATSNETSADGVFTEQLPDTEILIGTKAAPPADHGSS
jgi:SAM-dependent methyltransferase